MRIGKSLLALCLALTLVLSMAACTRSTEPTAPSTTGATEPASSIPADGSTLGEGQHSFAFQVKLQDGTAYNYTICTNEQTVGAALQALDLIGGEESEYGLYVTTVLGVTLDYNEDGYWWALSENGVDSPVGVDSVAITDGSTYAFTATAA